MKQILRIGAVGLISFLGACSQNTYPSLPATIVVDSTEIDGALFWPPHPHYVAQSDTEVMELVGLQRGFTCGTILACKMDTNFSGADSTALQAYAKIEYPGNPSCPLDPVQGIDTTLRLLISPPSGSILYLNNSIGIHTDTVLVVTAQVMAETLLTVLTDSDTVVTAGSFRLYNSIGTHDYYELYDSLLACEVLQSAVFTQGGDSLTIRLHLLLLNSTASQLTLPPCSGPQNDSVTVAPDAFNLPAY